MSQLGEELFFSRIFISYLPQIEVQFFRFSDAGPYFFKSQQNQSVTPGFTQILPIIIPIQYNTT